jgi:integrase
LEYIHFKRTKNDTDFVELDTQQVYELIKFDFQDKTLDKVRDFFVFGCLSGLRFDDIKSLTKSDFKITRVPYNNKFIISMVLEHSHVKVLTKKTQTEVILPMNQFFAHLVNKYDIENRSQGTKLLFNDISNQKLNEYIKVICKKAGFNKIIKISRIQGSNIITKEQEFYNFCSSHTMRRTFVSFVAKTINHIEAKKLTGHKDINILAKYTREKSNAHSKLLTGINGDFVRDFYEDEAH